MKLEPEVVEILSQRHEMLARIDPGGLGRRAYIKIMTHLDNSSHEKILNKIDIVSSYGEKTIATVKLEDVCKGDYFQAGDRIVLYDGGVSRVLWSVGYWRAHVDFESMTWEDLKNWKPLKEGEYEELLALVSQKTKFWVVEKIKSLFFSK